MVGQKSSSWPLQAAIVLCLVVLLAGCQSTAGGRVQTALADGATPAEASYRLGTDDRLRMIVFGQDDLSNLYTVDGDGNISVPLIGLVNIMGMTTADVEQIVAARLRDGFIRNPDVSVEIQTYRPFYILGEVRAPGQYPFTSGLTAREAVAVAGGFTERAAQRRVAITRSINGEKMRRTVPADTMVMPGDTIEIRQRLF